MGVGGGGEREGGAGRRLGGDGGGGGFMPALLGIQSAPSKEKKKKLACHLNPGDALSDVEDKWYASDSC